MKRFTLLFTLLSLGVFMAMLPGCSTEDAITNLIQGDTNSAEFQFVNEIIGSDAMEGFGNVSAFSFELIDSIPGATFSPKNSNGRQALGIGDEIILFDSLSYSWNGSWHVFAFSAMIIDTMFNDTIDISGIDSLQTLSNGTPIQVPDSSMDELRVRAHIVISERNGSFNGSGIHSIDITGITPMLIDPVTLNGSATETFSGTDSDSGATCNFAFSNALTVNNVVVSLEGTSGCPTSGSINMTANIDMTCIQNLGSAVDTVKVAGSWSFTGVFASDGSIAITISDGTTVWQTTEPCNQQPSAGPHSRWTHGF